MRSQNGWAVLEGDSELLHTWRIPTRHGVVEMRMRRGSVGFILAHWVMWWSERVGPVKGRTLDDWAWAPFRWVRGAYGFISNHCSGSAVDVNALQHPLGKSGTVGGLRARILRAARRAIYGGCITWGGVWNRPDEMHAEITKGKQMRDCERVARRLMRTPYGRRILAANPGQRAVILS